MYIIYFILFWLLLFEGALFAFLNLPTPRGWKGSVVKFLSTNRGVKNIMKGHLILLIIAALFFMDCHHKYSKFVQDKTSSRKYGNAMAELRASYLSYQILKIQRNKYITSMFIYMAFALQVYLYILQYMYDKRYAYEISLQKEKEKELERREKEPIQAY